MTRHINVSLPLGEPTPLGGELVQARHWVPHIHTYTHPEKGATYGAMLPFRPVISTGETPELALGSLIEQYCLLSREGSFNPTLTVGDRGARIQGALHLLEAELGHLLRQRAICGTASPIAQVNERIAAVGAAISAAARIKEV